MQIVPYIVSQEEAYHFDNVFFGNSSNRNIENITTDTHNLSDRLPFPERKFREDRMIVSVYIIGGLSLLGAIVSIFAGISLLSLLRKKERKELKKGMIDTLTNPEEKKIIDILEENNGELTQSELVKQSGISKVKIHRIIKHLENLQVVSKFPYGVTNKVILTNKHHEEDVK
jgi:uncharacterized membrane protein